jgi:hypothetical protein
MELVNEYLRAVAALLPAEQCDDIVAELRDTILSRVEERERESGQRLDDDGIEALLREIGHPLVVAARYREGPQHLVGPALYPYWVFAVKIAVTIQAFFGAITWLARATTHGDAAAALVQAVVSTVSGACLLVGIATVVAWAIERYGIRIDYLDHWRVKDLRALHLAGWKVDGIVQWLTRGLRGTRRTTSSRVSTVGSAIGDIVGGTILVLWWLGLLHFGWFVGPVTLHVTGFDLAWLVDTDWSALRTVLYWPVLGYGLLSIVKGSTILVWPRAIRLHGALEMAVGAALAGLAGWIWTASPLAPAIHVDSIAAFVHRAVALVHGWPQAIASAVMIAVASALLIGFCQFLGGFWKFVTGGATLARTQPPLTT